MNLEYKSVGFNITDVEEKSDSWTIKGYASTWDLDRGDDKVMPGAFKDCLLDRHDSLMGAGLKSGVKFLYQHDASQIIGWPTVIKEDEKGLYVEAEFIKDEDFVEARKAYKLCKMGLLDSFSIGFKVKDYEYLEDEENQKSYRILKILDLFEFSLVTVPMNAAARVVGVKSNENKEPNMDEIKALRDEVAALRESISELIAVVKPAEKEAVSEEAASEAEEKQEPTVEAEEVISEDDEKGIVVLCAACGKNVKKSSELIVEDVVVEDQEISEATVEKNDPELDTLQGEVNYLNEIKSIISER